MATSNSKKTADNLFQTEDRAPDLSLNRRLDLTQVLEALAFDGVLAADASRQVHIPRGGNRADVHPLVLITNTKLESRVTGKPLQLEELTEWLAQKAQLPYLKIDPTKIDVNAVGQVVASAYASRYRIVPVAIDDTHVTIATSEPFDTRWVADLSHILRREVKRVVSNPLDVNRFLVEFYGVTRSVQKARGTQYDDATARGVINFEQLVELGKTGEVGADDRHVVHIVDWLLQYAFDQRASDIHLEPRRETSLVRFRIDGVMSKVFDLPSPVMLAVVSRIKILGRLDVAEKRRPQDGRIKTRSPGGREVEMRLSSMPTAFGEKCVLRIFDPDIVLKNFGQLGFSKREDQIWRHMVERPNGIVLVTGPTGSGKTTTLYSTLKHLATPDINVCTVEDPIEMVSPEFNQMQVHHGIDLDFASGVRTLLRQDPDIIMVGEIRDLETAQMAVQASLTGHLVLSTLHTNDAPSAITRLLDLGVPHYLIQSTVVGIIAQRLVRTLCKHCKAPHPLDEDAWSILVKRFNVPKPKELMGPVGCLECRNTGFRGRTGIYEMMPITPELRTLIQPSMDLQKYSEAALQSGMKPLRISAAGHVARGLTTISEALGVLPTFE